MHAEPLTFRDVPCIRLQADGATALVALHGALVCSWIPADGRARLFLGEHARLDGSQTVHGGIPIVFPQFAARGPLPRHGFARTSTWRWEGVQGNHAVFALTGDGTPAWPHRHLVQLRIAMDATRLSITLDITNTGGKAFAFSAALHTYLRVADLADTTLTGLQGCAYEDQTDGGARHRERERALQIDDEVDRIYADASGPITLREHGNALTIQQDGFSDVVVWNPGKHIAADFSDLSHGDHRRFVCVEAARIRHPVELAPGERWRGCQRLG